jgi:hypothetical protein
MDNIPNDVGQREGDFAASPDAEPVEPWQEIAPGRFMPRRVRGSCHGRELG